MGRDVRPPLVFALGFVVALALFAWMASTGDFVAWIASAMGPLALFAAVFLWRVPVGHAADPPERVLAATAHGLRRALYRVAEAPGQLTVRIGSVSAVRLRAKAAPGGTALSYTPYATPAGWSVILILFLLPEFALFVVPVVLFILLQVRSVVRDRIAPLVAAGTQTPAAPPPGEVRATLIDSLSEGYRLASEAEEAEDSTYHDFLLVAFFAGFVTWAIVFLVAFSSAGGDFAERIGRASVIALSAGVLCGLAVGVAARRALLPGILRHREWAARLRTALEREVAGGPAEGASPSAFELLSEATAELPTWLGALGRGGLSREPGTWLVILFTAFWGVTLFGGAASVGAASPLLGLALGAGGLLLLFVAVRLYQGWRLRVDRERAGAVASWSARAAEIRAEMDRFLQDL